MSEDEEKKDKCSESTLSQKACMGCQTGFFKNAQFLMKKERLDDAKDCPCTGCFFVRCQDERENLNEQQVEQTGYPLSEYQ